MRRLRTATTTLTAVFASTLVSAAAFASDVTDGAGAAKGSLNSPSVNSIIGTVTNTLIFFVGAISVIVLIIGGLRYVISGGNSASVQGAKNTILYAIVGLVVSIAAYAIVQFVFSVLHVT